MKYTLDTLPVLDAYRENCECPLCRLRISCEDQYVDSMLGAAYMEPECRIKTNETGFCTRHFELMYQRRNRLGLALMTHTHMQEGHEEFKFVPVARTTQEPTSKWSWSDGKYYVDGSSNYSTLYTNYYFTSVKGKKFSFSAGSSNKVKVDLVHKGTIVQTVVSSWTISAGGSKSHTITADDLGGYSNSDKFYFRFNSSPIGNRYSISGYFG